MVIKANADNFQEIINKDKVIVDFYADWCGPCKMLAPIFEQLSDELTAITFAKVDVDQSKELADQFKIKSIPTLLIFEKGIVKNTLSGYIAKEKLASYLK